MPERSYAGGCHCGAIAYEYRTGIDPSDWSIRACQCTFCRAHDALSTSHPGATIALTANEPNQLQRYRFGLRTADFLVCRRCGVYIGAVIATGSGNFGIINTRALQAVPDNMAAVEPISYDDEDISGRVARREKRWAPVKFVG